MMGKSEMTDTDATAAAETEIIEACRRVVIEFSHRLDHREFDRVAGLFAPGGVWRRHGEELIGRQRVLEVVSARPASPIERHLVTTIHVEVDSPESARAVSYAVVIRGDRDATTETAGAGVVTVGEFHDQLVLTTDGWRIAERTSQPVFAFAASS